MSSPRWGWFPQPQRPWLKETLSKDGKHFQFTPDTSWMPSTPNQASHLDQNGRSFNSPSHSGSFSSVQTLFSVVGPFICVLLFFFPLAFLFRQTLVLFPLSLTLAVCQTSHQSWWLVPNCSAGSILSCFVWRDQNNQHEYGKTCSYGNIQPSNIHISQTNLA